MADELVHLEIAGGVATITLDSPANRNALSAALVAQLASRLDEAIGDPGARVIVLTGAGSAFCSGVDLSEQLAADDGGRARSLQAIASVLYGIWSAPKPVIARVNGPARAGGLGMVAACDIAVAAESTTFGFSEVRIGVAPAMIATVVIPRIGQARAMELMLTGEPFDARRAVEFGLLNAAVPLEELDATVRRVTGQLLKGAPGALAATKRLVREVPSLSVEEGLRAMTALSAELFGSDEGRAGMAALLEKRPPPWDAG